MSIAHYSLETVQLKTENILLIKFSHGWELFDVHCMIWRLQLVPKPLVTGKAGQYMELLSAAWLQS